MMAKGPPLGLFKPVQPASIGLVDS